MRRQGWNLKRDAAEKPIVEALKAVGAEYWYLSGKGVGDLLVRYKGVLHCGEVKSKGGRLEPSQGAFPIWRTPDQVLREIGAVK
jgi:hypothetical protein